MALADVKADLRRQVETASRGMATVRYTAKGQASYFYRLRKFTLDSLGAGFGTGTHPAFIVGGVERDEILIGIHQAAEVGGEMVSRAGLVPRVTLNHDQAVALARATGPGFCVATNAMYAALALQCRAAGVYPRGNTQYGRSHAATAECGINDSGNPATGGSAHTVIRAGSGPVTWSHQRSPWGVQNLNGNVWEWSPGMRIVDGEIQIIANNDAVLATTDLGTAGPWRAIAAADGALVAPSTAGAVKYATSGTAAGTLVCADNAVLSSMVSYGVSEAALQRLRALGLMTPGAPIETDRFYINLTGERLPIRGGSWVSGGNAGVFALNLRNGRAYSDVDLGFRPAFVT